MTSLRFPTVPTRDGAARIATTKIYLGFAIVLSATKCDDAPKLLLPGGCVGFADPPFSGDDSMAMLKSDLADIIERLDTSFRRSLAVQKLLEGMING